MPITHRPVFPIALAILVWSNAGAQTVNVGDAIIRYDARGQGDPIVLIHGWTNDLGYWDAHISELSRSHRVIRYDRRGWGASTGSPDVTSDPTDLVTLLDSLRIAAAHIVGHSQGSSVALAFAVAYPKRVRTLTLYGPPPPEGWGLPWTGPDRLPPMVEIARDHGMDSLRAVLAKHPLLWYPTPLPPAAEAYLARWQYDGRDLLRPAPPSGRTPAARVNQLSTLAMPTLVIHGDHEIPYFQVAAAALTYAIPNAQHVVIANAGHSAHLAQPSAFNREILAFINATGSR